MDSLRHFSISSTTRAICVTIELPGRDLLFATAC
jgi:hypothetical protein